VWVWAGVGGSIDRIGSIAQQPLDVRGAWQGLSRVEEHGSNECEEFSVDPSKRRVDKAGSALRPAAEGEALDEGAVAEARDIVGLPRSAHHCPLRRPSC